MASSNKTATAVSGVDSSVVSKNALIAGFGIGRRGPNRHVDGKVWEW